MNLLPVAHTIAKPNRNEKIILILIAAVYRMLCALQILRITAGRNEHLTGGRGRRLPVAIVLRFDRVGRREPFPTSSTLALLVRILYGSAVMFVKLARGWWSDTLPLPKKFRVQPSFFGNPIFD